MLPTLNISPTTVWYVVFGALLLVLSQLALWVNPYLHFNTELIQQGQYWRLYTGHFAHLNVSHGLMNVLGFWACCYFFADVYRLRHFSVWLLVGTPLISLAMLWLDPSIHYYVGLSGLLYGWLMFAIVAGYRTQPWLHGLGFVVLMGRVLWEQMPSYDTGYLLESIGGLVYVNAHLYGAILGLVAGAVVLSLRTLKQHGYT